LPIINILVQTIGMKRITILILIFLGNAVFADISSILLKDQEIKKLGTGMKFTEGPVWIKKDKKLIFSDIPKSLQMEWTEAKGVKKWREVKQSNGNLLDLNGNLLSCQHAGRNLIRTTANGEIEILADNFGGKKFNSPNDLAIRSDGEIWFTDPSYGLRGREAEIEGKWVYRRKTDGSIQVLCKTYDMPNGIAFSPDEKRVYIADSGNIGKIRAYDVVKEGLLGNPLFEIDIRCDGMCVDTEGRIYTTSRGGIHVYDSNGKKIGLIEVPEHPANVCFGGENFDTLFITARTSLYSIKINAKGHEVRSKN
jgi:gluconolactonase